MAKNAPTGYPAVSPYFIVHEADKFLHFLQTVFDATEQMVHRNDQGGIMHAQVEIDGSLIMFGEAQKEWPAETGAVFLYVKDADETYKRAMDAGSASRQEPDTKEYGRAAGVRDPFGNTWWITSI